MNSGFRNGFNAAGQRAAARKLYSSVRASDELLMTTSDSLGAQTKLVQTRAFVRIKLDTPSHPPLEFRFLNCEINDPAPAARRGRSARRSGGRNAAGATPMAQYKRRPSPIPLRRWLGGEARHNSGQPRAT
jgi:hypothetical protein